MELIQGEYIKIKQYFHKKKRIFPFEFALPFVDETQTFRETNRFLDESKRMTHFKNRYVGAAIIDITEWSDKQPNSLFRAFIYFVFDRELESNKNKHIFISENICSKEVVEAIESIFGDVNNVNLGVKKGIKSPIGFMSYIEQEGDKLV